MAKAWLIILVGAVVAGPARAQQPDKSGPAERPIAEWIRDLRNEDVLAREEAILVLGAMGPAAKEALPALTALLKDPAPTVRIKAALAAWQIDRGSKQAVPVLLEVLASGQRPQRLQVIALVAPVAEEVPEVVEALLKTAGDPDAQVSAKAQEAVGRVSSRTIPALTKLADHADAAIRNKAILQLGRFGPLAQPALPVLTARLKDEDWDSRFLVAQSVWMIDPNAKEVVGILVQAADKPDAAVRRTAFNILTQIKPPPKEALPVFRAALKDDQLVNQLRAAEILWELEQNPADVLPVLIKVFESPNIPDIAGRPKALAIVMQMGDKAKPVRPALIELMKTGHPALQISLPPVLARLGSESIPALIEMIHASKDRRPIQYMAAQTLGHIGKDAVGPLVKLIGHEDNAVRMAAFQALAMMGAQAKAATPALKDALKSPELGQRVRAVQCLESIGPGAKEAVPALLDATQDSEAIIRRGAFSALSAIGAAADDVRPHLERALKDSNNLVRIAAADFLWQIDPGAKDVLTTALELIKDRTGSAFYAARLLVKMGPHAKQAVPLLSEMLASADVQERNMAASALGQLGPLAKDAGPALIQALQTNDASFRMQVVQALRALRVRDKAMVGGLAEMLDKAPAFLQTQILQMLIDLGPDARAALPQVRQRLADKVPTTRLFAAEAMLAIDAKLLPEFRTLLEDMMKAPTFFYGVTAARILWQADPNDGKPRRYLEEKLRDPLFSTREVTARSLEACGPWAKEILPVLTEALEDSSLSVRAHAARALWKIEPGNKRVVPVLIDVLREKDDRPSRTVAATGLGDIGPAAREAIPWLRAAVRDVPHLRTAANEALRKIDPKAALPLVQP